ncbi:MAG TPA: FAD-dependent oxidoreductase, partial [Polyangia bacterium]|nr:FAD-dependent oxidoreductase [Polyangia bacterium]
IRAISQDDFEQAYLIVREKLPLPRVCALVCPHFCETRCRRGQLDESLAVRALKRAAIENGATAEPGEAALAPRTGKKVAIVGAGPAGLTAGYYLSRICGHHVEIFDELPDIGGMLRYGITRYHLPEAELEKDLEIIRRAGVVFHTGTRIESVAALQEQGFDAIFLALGAHKAPKLPIAGIDAPGVVDCVEFLHRVNAHGERPVTGNRVVVIGGGNTAVDAARTARRLGAERVEMFCLESRKEMPAFWREIAEAEEEGIAIHPSWGPTEITTAKGRATGVKLRRCSSVFDRDGRFDPRYDDRETAEAEADTVIMAVGQFPDIPADLGVETGRGNRITVDRQSPTTSQQGVFAGGDAVLGPASVIEAVAHGRRAAKAIDLYLGGSGEIEEVFAQPDDVSKLPLLVEETEARPRIAMDYRDSALRLTGFDQIELGYSRKAAVLEASRCLRCDLED